MEGWNGLQRERERETERVELKLILILIHLMRKGLKVKVRRGKKGGIMAQ